MKKLVLIIAVLAVLFTSCEEDKIELLKHPEVKDRAQTDTVKKVINKKS